MLQPSRLGDALTTWGNCRNCSECSRAFLCLKHKKACCALNGVFLQTGIGFRYGNETSKINTDVKRLCYLPVAKAVTGLRCGWASTTRMCGPVRRDFGILGRRTCLMNARLLSASSLDGV